MGKTEMPNAIKALVTPQGEIKIMKKKYCPNNCFWGVGLMGKFCSKCGAELTDIPIRCSQCSAQIDTLQEYCRSCGSKLK